MKDYFLALREQLRTWKGYTAIALTLIRLYYGYSWFTGGLHKFSWLTDGKLNSQGYISGMVENLATDRGDPFMLGRAMSWIADQVFIELLPQVTDALVVIFEFGVGIMLILGFKLFWTILVAIFLNLQFFAAGSTNNFGYMVTNLFIWKFINWFDAIGLDGFLRVKKGDSLL